MISLTENIDSRKWSIGPAGRSCEKNYVLDGVSDDLVAKRLLEDSVAQEYDGLVRQSIDAQADWVDTTANRGRWNVVVRYGEKPAAEPDEFTLSFDTSGGTQHLTQAIKHIGGYACPGKSLDDKINGQIGVAGTPPNRTVEGVDVPVAVWNLTLRRRIPLSRWTPAYVGALHALTGKVNSGVFWISVRGQLHQFNAGEVLFLGACGDDSAAADYVDVTYRFAVSPNVADACADWDVAVKPAVPVPKKGWEYLWVLYEDSAGEKEVLKTPKGVYVEQVHHYGDFSGIEPPQPPPI